MKELYMTVFPDSPLYREYFMWLSDYKKVKEIYGEIQKNMVLKLHKFIHMIINL